MAKAPALAVLLDPLVPWTRALFSPTRHRRNLFFFFEKGTNFHVILSLSPQPARRSKSEQSQKTDKHGKASSCGREGQHRGVPEAPDRGGEIHEGSPRTQAVSHDDLNKGQLPGFGREAWLRGVLPPPPTLSFFQATRKTDSLRLSFPFSVTSTRSMISDVLLSTTPAETGTTRSESSSWTTAPCHPRRPSPPEPPLCTLPRSTDTEGSASSCSRGEPARTRETSTEGPPSTSPCRPRSRTPSTLFSK